jgi:hypothetical protein
MVSRSKTLIRHTKLRSPLHLEPGSQVGAGIRDRCSIDIPQGSLIPLSSCCSGYAHPSASVCHRLLLSRRGRKLIMGCVGGMVQPKARPIWNFSKAKRSRDLTQYLDGFCSDHLMESPKYVRYGDGEFSRPSSVPCAPPGPICLPLLVLLPRFMNICTFLP